jgi:hypothetical protein
MRAYRAMKLDSVHRCAGARSSVVPHIAPLYRTGGRSALNAASWGELCDYCRAFLKHKYNFDLVPGTESANMHIFIPLFFARVAQTALLQCRARAEVTHQTNTFVEPGAHHPYGPCGELPQP